MKSRCRNGPPDLPPPPGLGHGSPGLLRVRPAGVLEVGVELPGLPVLRLGLGEVLEAVVVLALR
eukprot:12100839-Alexandrium_andersonii.AAC.1